jgi:hypothetical protein
MFRAVRNWWESGRGKVTARLFVFELFVVIVGVFIAQALANWVHHRGEIQRMERSDRFAGRAMALSYGSALVWQRAFPCLSDRLAQIMRLASEGAVPSRFVSRPRVERAVMAPLPSEDFLLLREVKGDRRAALIDSFVANVAAFNNHIPPITGGWGRIELVDERFGSVSQGDREAARQAAADIRAHLRATEVLGRDIIADARQAGIKPAYLRPGYGPARSCEAIWRSGRINPPLTMR